MRVIKNCSTNQHKIITDIIQLYIKDNIECDITYSKGFFYGEHTITNDDGEKELITITEPLHKFDVFPQSDDVQKLDVLHPIPLDDASINSIIIDLPFVLDSTNDKNLDKDNSRQIFKRFHGFKHAYDLYQQYYHWIKEASRVLRDNGYLIFKCQNTVGSGINHMTETWSQMVGMRVGLVVRDVFQLIATSRMISPFVKNQIHARKYTSSFIVFQKSTSTKYDRFNYYTLLDRLDNGELLYNTDTQQPISTRTQS